MSKAPRRILIPVLVLVAVLVAIASFVGSAPAVCASCHAMKPYADAQDSTAHKNIDCYACHLQAGAWDWPAFKLTEVTRMYPRAKETSLTGPASRIATAPCLTCHADVLAGAVVSGGIRIKHSSCTPVDSCDGCHAASAHGETIRWTRRAIMEECVDCHVEQHAARECNTCHGARTQAERLAKGAWKTTHATDWKSTHGMGDLRYCRTCHTVDACMKCHPTGVPSPSTTGTSTGAPTTPGGGDQ